MTPPPLDEGDTPQGVTPESHSRIGEIVAALRDLRVKSHRTRYGDASLPDLPSKTATAEIIDGLVAAMFPRHFGPAGLLGESIDGFVAFALTTALQALQKQVRLELELTAHHTQAVGDNLAARATEIASQFADEIPTIRALLETDIRAAFEGDPAAKSLDEVMSCYPGVLAIINHRLAHGFYRLGAPMLARMVSEAAHSATGIDIHPGAQIGEHFFIDHGTGVVIGETTVIGNRVRIYQAVTLGAKRFEIDQTGVLLKDYPRHPIIEDDVVVYAGATILGRITVGAGSAIAGNVWLTHSVPPGSVITQAKERSDTADNGGL
jgi:serine O-acetyltransferase